MTIRKFEEVRIKNTNVKIKLDTESDSHNLDSLDRFWPVEVNAMPNIS